MKKFAGAIAVGVAFFAVVYGIWKIVKVFKLKGIPKIWTNYVSGEDESSDI